MHQARGQHHRILSRLQVLHYHQAEEPSLPPGTAGQGGTAQLYDHTGRTGGPAPGDCGCQGAVRLSYCVAIVFIAYSTYMYSLFQEPLYSHSDLT